MCISNRHWIRLALVTAVTRSVICMLRLSANSSFTPNEMARRKRRGRRSVQRREHQGGCPETRRDSVASIRQNGFAYPGGPNRNAGRGPSCARAAWQCHSGRRRQQQDRYCAMHRQVSAKHCTASLRTPRRHCPRVRYR